MSTHNLCFEQKYEKYQKFLSKNFHFLVVKFSVYLNRHVFVMFSQRIRYVALLRGRLRTERLIRQRVQRVFFLRRGSYILNQHVDEGICCGVQSNLAANLQWFSLQLSFDILPILLMSIFLCLSFVKLK